MDFSSIASAASGALSAILDFFKPAEDQVVVYDIQKRNANSMYVILIVFIFLVFGIVVFSLTRK